MAINQWRYVRYTDDGCVEYQCLKCYKSWEARTAPGWVDTFEEIGTYHPYFNFCPICGTKWDGQRNGEGYNERAFGKKRFEINEKVNEVRWSANPPKGPRIVWALEVQSWHSWQEKPDLKWRVESYFSMERYSAFNMFEILKQKREQNATWDHREDETVNLRISKIKLESSYNHYIIG